jgi:transcriptional regulator with XRE-family HTH domain
MLDTTKIKKFRTDAKLTQEAAAEKAGIGSRQQWNDIESGRKANIGMDTLGKIATALGVDAADLLVKAKKTAKGK